jgi:exonuclease V gamma subunit
MPVFYGAAPSAQFLGCFSRKGCKDAKEEKRDLVSYLHLLITRYAHLQNPFLLFPLRAWRHLRLELQETATVRKYWTVQVEGERQVKREQDHYNLQMIIAVGFKVNNERAERIRKIPCHSG